MEKLLKILMIEDGDADAKFIELELKASDLNFVLNRVTKINDFIPAYRDFKPDVILADYDIGSGDNALDLLKLLKEQKLDGKIPFLLVTGSITDSIATQCVQEGMDDYVLKDSGSLGHLATAILNALRRKNVEIQLKEKMEELKEYTMAFEKYVEAGSMDLREILKRVTVFGYQLQKESGKALGAKGAEYIAKIQETTIRMEQWLHGLLALFKKYQKE